MKKTDGAEYLAWLEDRDWSELQVGQLVNYDGRLWRVVTKLKFDRYTLRSLRNMWHTANVDRIDIIVGYDD